MKALKSLSTFVRGWRERKQRKEREFAEMLSEWGRVAEGIECTCGNEYLTPWLHAKHCGRWSAKRPNEKLMERDA